MNRTLVGLAFLAFGCAGSAPTSNEATASRATTGAEAPTLSFRPDVGQRYTFVHEVESVEGTEHRSGSLSGTWSIAADGAGYVTTLVVSAAEEASHRGIGVITQRLDASGLLASGEDATNADSFELFRILVDSLGAAPIGTAGVALPLDHAATGDAISTSRVPLLAMVRQPTDLPMQCSHSAEESGDVALSCSYAREAPMDPPEGGEQWTFTLRVEITIRARLDAATGLARSVEQHLVMDVRQELGDHVEHEGGDYTVRTTLTPAP